MPVHTNQKRKPQRVSASGVFYTQLCTVQLHEDGGLVPPQATAGSFLLIIV